MSDDIRPELHKIGYGQAITPADTPEATSGDFDMKSLLLEYLRAGQALRGDTVQIVPDIASRAMKLDRIEAKILSAFAALRSENEALRKFVEWCMDDGSWQGFYLDGGEVQDKAEELGLIVEVPADEAFREEYDGDTMYVLKWSAELRRIQDSGEPT